MYRGIRKKTSYLTIRGMLKRMICVVTGQVNSSRGTQVDALMFRGTFRR